MRLRGGGASVDHQSSARMASDSPPSQICPGNMPLFSSIGTGHAGYNELQDELGQFRPHWRPIVDAISSAGTRRLHQQQLRAEKMRHEDGATFNPFADPEKRSSCWPLDILPLPLSADDWLCISGGISQRATLLEALLEDVYGPQRLLHEGKIPPELLFANPRFLHPCHSIIPAGGRFLSFYAADIYRDRDGSFKVLRDYGSHPAGLGYALENRIVLSRIFPDLYHGHELRLLAPFFQQLHRSIIERNELGGGNPGIVLLSPGPECATYFEHALLSRYLGYPLVESQDLTVRDGKVFLKKLAGLDPVEAIFRQIPDSASDPFGLRQQNSSGVAGLIQAAREGMLDLINPLGAGFIDTPVLPHFLPGLCRELLGEELLLASRGLIWGGDPEQVEQLLASPKSIRRSLSSQAALPETDNLAEAILAGPHEFMAVAPVLPSLVPVWQDGATMSQPVVLRVFCCATAGGFTVLPGGLAITAPDITTLLDGHPTTQQSKDIWVLSDSPVEQFSMLSALEASTEFNRSSDLPSRVADNLLWLGRYLERSEGHIRLLRAISRRISSEARLHDIPELLFLLSLLPSDHNGEERIPSYREIGSLHQKLLYDKEHPASITTMLLRVRDTARNVRDRLSLDCWRVISHLEDLLDHPTEDPLEFLNDTLYNLSAFSGLAMESMTRGFGWRFMDMGRRLERAMFQSTILQRALPDVCNTPRTTLEALLEVGDSAMTYRARYRTTYQLAPVLDLLIVDESNPKSMAFQFSQLAGHVEHLPRSQERRYSTPEERIALEMLTATRLLDLQTVSCDLEHREPLDPYFKRVDGLLHDFAQRITAHYLSRVPATPHFTGSSEREEV